MATCKHGTDDRLCCRKCEIERAENKSALNDVVKLPFSVSHIIRLVREYVEVNKCSCITDTCCWKCTFEYNLRCLDHEKETATKTASED